MSKKDEKKVAEEAPKKDEASVTEKVASNNLEAVTCILLSGGGKEGTAVIAPGGVFEATPAQVKKLVDNGSAKRTSKPVSTPEELAKLHAAHTNGLRRKEKERIEAIRRSNQ